jgi:DNA-directed RNA polymerase I, II, and III subunit RPABC2
MSDSEDYDIDNDAGDEYDDSELQSLEEEIEDNADGVDVLEEAEEDAYIDLKFNNRSKFDNFSKVMELSNMNYNEGVKRKTTPQLTKYEKTKILGIRAQQLASGMPALIQVPKDVRDVRKIAELELQQRKIPFIIKRPLPNKGCEYIKIEDLEYIK